MSLRNRSVAVAAIVLLHLFACALIALGCWLNPTQHRVGQPPAVAGKPGSCTVAQRTKSPRMTPLAHTGQCCLKPVKN